ncbi:Proline--tRNA ligase [Hondaea fermentalgiana]|uniref:proline--tRNA ligase n=1 Tax=Hondaea fermentalgiana TaxID=2315210 RepID=A0A2R5GSZ8_9STRA|nr:Proline--tRNA ligase [Hondaea fermentalgiana]|eukprot:GBG33715.1 Proline--tRNA ligase [Hondaea fermentalgiana]
MADAKSHKQQKKKTTKLGLSVAKEDDFSEWYTQVITKSEMIEYYNISGCYILRPWSFKIWERIQQHFDGGIKKLGVEPCYFPMFVSKRNLSVEEDHIEDFAPEVAWVTKSGDSELEEPIAIRPTSETIMYPAYAKWIRSHRDLPLQLNQWTNVVRWEFKNPTPFLRTREFLWQEGHSAFATKEEADKEVLDILDLYARVYEELLAVPVIKGRKSHKEKFPGGDFTTTVEAFIPCAGRAIQAATSHSLGQNFSRMFKIKFLAEDDKSGNAKDDTHNYVWQNSWGLTTRSIGVAVMVHGDNQGLVLPPRVAPIQLVGVPIYVKDGALGSVMDDALRKILDEAEKSGLRVKLDDRTDKNPGWKYNYYEQRGVPLRVEIGSRDLEAGKCVLVRRDNGAREDCTLEQAGARCVELMDVIQADMLDRARQERDSRLAVVWTWDEFVEELMAGNMVLAPWSLTTKSEEWVKDETKRISEERAASAGKGVDADQETNADGESKKLTGAAKTLCIPFNQPPMPEGTMCFTGCGEPAKEWCLWGRSF